VPVERVRIGRAKKAELPNRLKSDDMPSFGGGEPGHVFQQREARSYVAKDARGGGPKVACVVGAAARPGHAERLAGETGSDDLHASTPWSAVEGAGVVPDREQGEHAVALPPKQNLAAVRLAFDRADGVPAEQSSGEDAPTSSGK
jgi:hypothetical protein